MSKERLSLDDLINKYTEMFVTEKHSNLSEKGNDIENIKTLLARQIKQDIEEEIINKYKHKIIAELKSQNKKFLSRQNAKNTLVLLIETIGLSGLIGLIVNQLTDLISILKGNTGNITATLLVLLCITGFTVIYVIAMYLEKFSDKFGITDTELDKLMQDTDEEIK